MDRLLLSSVLASAVTSCARRARVFRTVAVVVVSVSHLGLTRSRAARRTRWALVTPAEPSLSVSGAAMTRRTAAVEPHQRRPALKGAPRAAATAIDSHPRRWARPGPGGPSPLGRPGPRPTGQTWPRGDAWRVQDGRARRRPRDPRPGIGPTRRHVHRFPQSPTTGPSRRPGRPALGTYQELVETVSSSSTAPVRASTMAAV
jgi:hypothetical protein